MQTLERTTRKAIEGPASTKPKSITRTKSFFKRRAASGAIIGLLYVAGGMALGGCNGNTPAPRIGTLPTSTIGVPFLDPNNLGSHSYNFDLFEKNGIVITRKAGSIDIYHLRTNADNTRYLISRTRDTLMKEISGFSFRLPFELSEHIVEFSYPDSWDSLPQEEKANIIDEISFKAGPYLAYNAAIWHEILTWFGVRFFLVEPEFNSAFSWDDIYSNVLGIKVGIEALNDSNHEYNEAMTLAINRQLERLGAQPRITARCVTEQMRGKWFTGNLEPDVLRKNLDIGLDDGYVSPVLIPGISEGAEPEPLPVPTLDVLPRYGFSLKYKISPVYLEKRKIFGIFYTDRKGKYIEPAIHYPGIIDFIKKEAVEKYGYDVGDNKANTP
jgi:hypothetical protein